MLALRHRDLHWDDHIRDHIARHGVTPEEAEQVFLNDPLDLGWYEECEEMRSDMIGQTKRGRILQIVITMKEEQIRIVTSYELSTVLRKRYIAYKGSFYE